MEVTHTTHPTCLPACTQDKQVLARYATFLSATCACLAVAGAAVPWLSFQTSGLPTITIGLYQFCIGSSCVDLAQADTLSPLASNLCELKVSAAMFYIAFILLVFSSAAGLIILAGSTACGCGDGKLKAVLSITSAVLLFIGEVTAGRVVRGAGSRACASVRAPPAFVCASAHSPPPF